MSKRENIIILAFFVVTVLLKVCSVMVLIQLKQKREHEHNLQVMLYQD